MVSFAYFWAQGRFKEGSGRTPTSYIYYPQDVRGILPLELVLPLKGRGYLNQAQDTKLEPGTPNRNASALLSAFWLFLNLYEATVPWHSDRGE